MLIQFKVSNYRSFRETQTLSLVASAAKEHFESHTMPSGINELGHLVRSAAIYGPNAAGKTNVLRAMLFMQQLVVTSATTPPTTRLPHDPFKLTAASREAPTDFEVAFIENGVRYEYGFSLGSSRIENEWLIEYPRGRGRRLFDRSWNKKLEKYDWSFSTYFKGSRTVWSDATRDNALFLSIAIQLNNQQLKPVFDWFQKRVAIVVGGISLNASLTLRLFDQPDGKERLLPFLREADSGIADVEIEREPLPAGAGYMFGKGAPIFDQPNPNSPPQIVRVTLSHPSNDAKGNVKFDISDEANGTQALFRSAGAWLNVFANGQILFFDEIDTSLHPLLTRYLVEQFHSDNINSNRAQLVFTTHDTTLLNQDLFRRDQIWFVEKQPEACTRLFPLTDFSPRNDEVIERWYLRGRYGALPVFDRTKH